MQPNDVSCDLREQGKARRTASLQSALAPILQFLQDPDVVEIMLNPDGRVWVEKVGRGMWCTEVQFSPHEAERMLRSIAGELDLELNRSHPSLSCKLPLWGLRVQATIPPIVAAPTFALRKPCSTVLPLDHYIQQRIITAAQAAALRAAVLAGDNILVGGGTGSGKTTIVNALLQVLQTTDERVLIIEDTSELQCASPNQLSLLVSAPHYTWRNAVMDAMRYRPDRIIVGEVRDGAALDLLKAWNTGHRGGLATIHANDTRTMLDRFCQLIEEVIPNYPRAVVAQTVHVCVHMSRDPSSAAGRCVTGIDRVTGYHPVAGWLLEPLVATPERQHAP